MARRTLALALTSGAIRGLWIGLAYQPAPSWLEDSLFLCRCRSHWYPRPFHLPHNYPVPRPRNMGREGISVGHGLVRVPQDYETQVVVVL
ncbi:hypothetical protein BO70DRAFT_140371 [Aspergillus heteromorphus CBS 117.55]|uniref:Secreted protein n=1 Tax=Aspergillus heteromorphus CBS 117.55 TaxID=1448321 RepID=A0A317VAU4_9EURO|nr:uncharacterized protein BO70DRAFT_140371 [Aspergillus heteromorphus CBS 117.55]PWY70187.1 hypothetical protein BO70DRAFT_140371 [Aspergillus heteromorphus CBS 117.55]